MKKNKGKSKEIRRLYYSPEGWKVLFGKKISSVHCRWNSSGTIH